MPIPPVPSVTRVLSDMGLTTNYDAIAGRAALEARDRGHRIHACLERVLAEYGGLPLPEESRVRALSASPLEEACALEVFDYLSSRGLNAVLGLEQRIVHPTLRFSGQRDALVELKARETLLDLKTGMLAPSHIPQGAAYVELEAASRAVRPGRADIDILIVYADPALGVRPVLVDVPAAVRGWQTFERALHLWHWRRDAGLLPRKE